MATRADIECQNCNNTFQFFWHFFEKQLPVACPYCDKVMSDNATEMLRHSLGSTNELNKELRKNHEEREEALFKVSIHDVFVPIEKFDFDSSENL